MSLARFRSAWGLVGRHIIRDACRHKTLALLNIGSVALGIAVFLAIQIAMHSANRSFSAGVDLVVGKSNLEIRGAIADEVFPQISKQPEVLACTPLVEGFLSLPDIPGEYLQLVGVDLFTNEPFRTFEMGGLFDALKWLGQPYSVALTHGFAQRHGINIGDRLRVAANGRLQELTVSCFLEPGDSPAGSRFAVMDLGWAQELLEMRGQLSSLQMILKEPQRAAQTSDLLKGLLPLGLRVEAPGQRTFQVQNMLSAFELNLRALSMVSLFVGMFLIYNTVSASVARRVAEIGIWRATGASRLQVRCLFLGEALLFAAMGVALGLVGGIALAQGLLAVIAKTISSLYVVMSIERSFLHPLHVLGAVAAGAITALLGAWMPANMAANLDPVAAISLDKRRGPKTCRHGFWAIVGISGVAISFLCAWLALSGAWPWLSFSSAFFLLGGSAALAPSVTFLGGKCLRFTKGPVIRMAGYNLQHSLGRNAMTVAALSTAVAMMSAIAIMIFSFRSTVSDWIGLGMTADLYITPAANELGAMGAFISNKALDFLRNRPEVDSIETFRETNVDFSVNQHSGTRESALAVVGGTVRRDLRFVGGADREKRAKLFSGAPVVAVTESFARKVGVREGQYLQLQTPTGSIRVQVVGVYYDYSRDSGVIMMYTPFFVEHWRDTKVQSLGVHLREKSDREVLAESIRARLGKDGHFAIYSNRELKQRVLHIFDQTFAVTNVLRVIAVVVAVAGLSLSATALVLERKREIGLLRSLGASRLQIQSLFLFEAGAIGFLASTLGTFSGMALAWVLTAVVNPAFFGWTIHLVFPVATLALTPLWMTLVAVPAAWWPSLVAGCSPIAAAVRNE